MDGKLQKYGVNGNSPNDDIREALRTEAKKKKIDVIDDDAGGAGADDGADDDADDDTDDDTEELEGKGGGSPPAANALIGVALLKDTYLTPRDLRNVEVAKQGSNAGLTYIYNGLQNDTELLELFHGWTKTKASRPADSDKDVWDKIRITWILENFVLEDVEPLKNAISQNNSITLNILCSNNGKKMLSSIESTLQNKIKVNDKKYTWLVLSPRTDRKVQYFYLSQGYKFFKRPSRKTSLWMAKQLTASAVSTATMHVYNDETKIEQVTEFTVDVARNKMCTQPMSGDGSDDDDSVDDGSGNDSWITTATKETATIAIVGTTTAGTGPLTRIFGE
jgi:hypothetical protein